MLLLDDSYATMVAFIEGFNVALDGRPLHGFNDWVSRQVLQRQCGTGWSMVIASIYFPAALRDGEGSSSIREIPPDIQPRIKSELLDLLESFASAKG
jgi:hypothetical protein